MPEIRRLAFGLGSVVAGAAAGYAAERLVVRPRVRRPRPQPLEEIPGDPRTVAGPDGVRLHVEVHDPGLAAAPEVVLVHGVTMGSAYWHEQVAALRDTHRLVVYDHPGHGRSTGPDGEYSLDLLADCLAAVIRETTEPERGPLVLAGHSLGGMTLLAFAERHPDLLRERVGALLLLSTSSTASAESRLHEFALAAIAFLRGPLAVVGGRLDAGRRDAASRYLTGIDLSHVITRSIAFGDEPDPAHVRLTIRLFLEAEPAAAMALVPVILRLDKDEALRAIDLPTIVVVGSEDRLTPVSDARHIAEVNPDVELLELPGIGHMTPMESPAVVNALLVRLTGQLRESRGRTGPAPGRAG